MGAGGGCLQGHVQVQLEPIPIKNGEFTVRSAPFHDVLSGISASDRLRIQVWATGSTGSTGPSSLGGPCGPSGHSGGHGIHWSHPADALSHLSPADRQRMEHFLSGAPVYEAWRG